MFIEDNMNKIVSIKRKLDEKKEFELFFKKYQDLSDAYDKAVLELYDLRAIVSATRIMSDGSVSSMSFEFENYKELVLIAWDAGEKANDRSAFSDIRIELIGEKGRITARRYSMSKCYSDEDYFMVVHRNDSGELKILEEHTTAPQISRCPNQDDLVATIEAYAKFMNEQTPIEVDDETRLTKVVSNETILTYQYELVNCVASEVDVEDFEVNMRGMLTEYVKGPRLRPLIEQGAVVSFQYFGCDDVEVTTININRFTCKII